MCCGGNYSSVNVLATSCSNVVPNRLLWRQPQRPICYGKLLPKLAGSMAIVLSTSRIENVLRAHHIVSALQMGCQHAQTTHAQARDHASV